MKLVHVIEIIKILFKEYIQVVLSNQVKPYHRLTLFNIDFIN